MSSEQSHELLSSASVDDLDELGCAGIVEEVRLPVNVEDVPVLTHGKQCTVSVGLVYLGSKKRQ